MIVFLKTPGSGTEESWTAPYSIPCDFLPYPRAACRSPVIGPRRLKTEPLREYWKAHPDAEAALKSWYKVVEDAAWKTPKELAQTINGVDPVKVTSGAVVSVFNIAHNKHRLIAHFHFDKQRVFVLRIMTHKEYDRGTWKEEL